MTDVKAAAANVPTAERSDPLAACPAPGIIASPRGTHSSSVSMKKGTSSLLWYDDREKRTVCEGG